MDNPGLLIEEIEPGVESGIGIKVSEMSGQFKPASLEFGAEKRDDRITPLGFEDTMMEIGVAHPALIIQCQTAGGGGKMNMEIAFEIASKSMDGRIDARDEMFLRSEVFGDVGRDRSDFVEKMAVEPEKRLKMSGQSESNVLPSRVRECVKSGFDPIVGGLFPAGGTETRFAGMRRLDPAKAFWTDKDMPAEKRSSAGKHFKHIKNNGFTNQFSMAKKKPPPVAVIDEDVPDFDLTADEFHRGIYSKFKR